MCVLLFSRATSLFMFYICYLYKITLQDTERPMTILLSSEIEQTGVVRCIMYICVIELQIIYFHR